MNWVKRLLIWRMLPLAELLDDRHFETMANRMMGLYHGRPVTFVYFSHQHSREFSVLLSCRSAFSFYIQKGHKRKEVTLYVRDKQMTFYPDKQMTFYGVKGSPDLILSSVEIGDPELDRQLHVWCDSPQSFTDWMGRAAVKENVASLVLAENVASLVYLPERVQSLQLGNQVLAVIYRRFGFFRRSLKEEMTPWNVTLVLQKLETLAQSLES